MNVADVERMQQKLRDTLGNQKLDLINSESDVNRLLQEHDLILLYGTTAELKAAVVHRPGRIDFGEGIVPVITGEVDWPMEQCRAYAICSLLLGRMAHKQK